MQLLVLLEFYPIPTSLALCTAILYSKTRFLVLDASKLNRVLSGRLVLSYMSTQPHVSRAVAIYESRHPYFDLFIIDKITTIYSTS
jgi:hypothetical protein